MIRLSPGKQITLYGFLMIGVIGIVASLFFMIRDQAAAENSDWPPLTMIYEVAGPTRTEGDGPPQASTEVHRLEYQSKNEWIDTVIEAQPVETRYGIFSNVGSFQRLSGGEYTSFSSITNSADTEKVKDGVTMIPRGGLAPFPIQMIEDAYDIELTRVATNSKVCFHDQCEENADGLLLADNGRELVFVDDARGIPLKIGDYLVVKEVQIHDVKHEVNR